MEIQVTYPETYIEAETGSFVLKEQVYHMTGTMALPDSVLKEENLPIIFF